jgi:hypothetical protein
MAFTFWRTTRIPLVFDLISVTIRSIPLISLENEIINLEKSHDLIWPCLVVSGRKLIELHPDTFPVSASAQSKHPQKQKKDVK